MYYWFLMIIAILSEVIGILAMKLSVGVQAPFTGFLVMYGMLIISYAALALAIKGIHLTVAYGAWESIGLILISLAGALFFAEPLPILKIMGILLIVSGMFLLNTGSYRL